MWLSVLTFVGICMMISMTMVAGAFVLPSIYRSQEPLIQEIWCNRASNAGMDFVCDWKATPAFETIPTPPNASQDNPLLILTPASSIPQPTITQTSAVVMPSPSATFTQSPTATVTPSVLPTQQAPAIPASHKLDIERIRYEQQGWNNCGPATLTMGLSYFGYQNNQALAASYLKPSSEDKNVSPYQMVNYVNNEAAEALSEDFTRP